jgi:20S proteasome alpha/beta subunit
MTAGRPPQFRPPKPPEFRPQRPPQSGPRPLKHLGYPFESEVDMTLIAGFRHSDGILMCADTLVGGGRLSSNDAKMVGYRTIDGAVLFGCAGDIAMADAAIQECEPALDRYSGKPRTKAEMLGQLKKTLGQAYKTHIIENNFIYTNDYAILIVIYSERDGLDLYETARTQIRRCRKSYQCIGAGDVAANLSIRQTGYDATHGYESAVMIATTAMAKSKKHHRDSVAGNSILLNIEVDGHARAVPYKTCGPIEATVWMFDVECGHLFRALYTAEDETFDRLTSGFMESIRAVRESYKYQQKQFSGALPPPEAVELERQLNTPEFMERLIIRKEARSTRQSTTHDPSGRPASQE